MMTTAVAPASLLYQRTPATLEVALGDALVLFEPAAGRFCDVNDIGRAIWELLAAPRTISELVAELRKRYTVDEDTCKREAQTFLATLTDNDFVSTTSTRDATAEAGS